MGLLLSLARAEVVDRVVAVVSDTPILLSDVNTLLGQFQKTPNLANFYGLKPSEVSFKKTLDLLLNEAIIRHQLGELQAGISESDVQKQINSIAASNNLNVSQLRQSLSREGIPFDAYERNIRMQLERKALFDRELRSSASNVSEAELRADFEKSVQQQWKLWLWARNNSSEARSEMNSVLRDFRNRKLPLDEIKKTQSLDDMGWVNLSSINKTFQEALSGKGPRSASDVVTLGNIAHVLFVEDIRKGSDEQFEAMKEELLRKRQGENLEDVFNAWVERKKQEMQVVINQ